MKNTTYQIVSAGNNFELFTSREKARKHFKDLKEKGFKYATAYKHTKTSEDTCFLTTRINFR